MAPVRGLRRTRGSDYTPAMKTNRIAALFLALFALTVLAACGNKGDLVRPTETTEKPATP